MPTRNISVVLTAAIVSLLCYQKAEQNRYARTFAEAMRLIDTEYVEKVEQRELFERAMDGMLAGLDQYSQYFGPEPYRQMEESLDQKFGGVGIVVEKTSDQEPLLVLSPVVGTPAYKAGIRAGDKILEINGESTIGMTSADAIKRMRGEPGTAVVLKVVHPDVTPAVELTLVRAEIPVESVLGDSRRPDTTWEYQLGDDPRIGYLHVITFGKQTSTEIQRILASNKFDAIILDLRGNAGGLLSAAVETCDLFIDSGRIVSTRGRGEQDRDVYDATSSLAVPKSVPMVVLTNRFSASASEIVAACLQDHERAIVIGQRTWGKGTVQNLFRLESGRCALKITTATYWRPSGRNIHRSKNASDDDNWGVRPSDGFEVAMTDEEYDQILKARQIRVRGQTRPNDSLPEPNPAPSPDEPSPSEPKDADRPALPATSPPPDTPPPDAPSPDAPSPGATPASNPDSAASVADRQLKRAVEYLQEQLRKTNPGLASSEQGA